MLLQTFYIIFQTVQPNAAINQLLVLQVCAYNNVIASTIIIGLIPDIMMSVQ